MSDQDAFARILASLYEAMLDDSHWPATAGLIDEACGLQGNALGTGDVPKEAAQDSVVGFYSRGERRTDLEHAYLAHYLSIDECVPRWRQLPDSRLVHITDLYTAEELKTSRTYNELLPQGNAQDSVNVRLDGPDGSRIYWRLGNPVAPGGWESRQLTMIERLLPHIRQFVRVRQALGKAGALGTSMSDLLDTPRIGVIQLDRRGQIMEANDRARAILRHGDGLADQGRMLRARDPADHDRLEQLLAAALPTSSIPAVSGSMLLHRAYRPTPFVVHIHPVVVPQPDYGAQRVAALVLITEPGYTPRIDPALVAATLGLTPVESQIAVRLAAGQTVQEIAATTGRTEGSVYWYLKQVYRKQGIARQADLVRLVLSVAEFV